MRNRKLTYRFHDPNPPSVAAEYILKVCIEANTSKVEQALREAMEKADQTVETVDPDEPGSLDWEMESGEQDEIEEMEPEKCPSRNWTMTMM